MAERVKNSLFGLVLFLAGVFLLYSSYRQAAPVSLGQDPFLFPRILLWMWVVLSFVVFLRDLTKDGVRLPVSSPGRLLIVIFLVGAACVLMNVTGFITVGVGFFVLYAFVSGFRRLPALLVLGAGFTGAVWLLFNFALEISLPPFPW